MRSYYTATRGQPPTIYYYISLFVVFVPVISCNNADHKTNPGSKVIFTYSYDSLSIPDFFETVIKNHSNDFYSIDSLNYKMFCDRNNIVSNDSLNKQKYYTVKILHQLFTSKSAINCSRGEIMNIPYYWHWISPNPRYDIRFTGSNDLLCQTKPPKGFSKYKSYADVDRIPSIFLGDLFAEKPKYYSASCDTFYTFGWCTEREMAFVSIMQYLNYKAKVVASGNHSWTELLIEFKTRNDTNIVFNITVDNTFDVYNIKRISAKEITSWNKKIGTSGLSGWYNSMAHAENEIKFLKSFMVKEASSSRIENEIVDYINRKW